MQAENLAYRTARNRVQAFANEGEDLLAHHQQAMDCRECELFLQLGIDAFDWLCRADTEARKSVLRGDAEYDPSAELALLVLHRQWLRPVEFAKQWIAVQSDRGFELENLERFQECLDEVQAIVESNGESTDMVEGEIEELMKNAVESFRRGETVEWEVA